jgi:hypothetical protein
VEKYCRTGQATDDNMAHAHCKLDAQVYKHTLRICNTHCFSTATMVARTRLVATLYVHCLSCFVSRTFCKPAETFSINDLKIQLSKSLSPYDITDLYPPAAYQVVAINDFCLASILQNMPPLILSLYTYALILDFIEYAH